MNTKREKAPDVDTRERIIDSAEYVFSRKGFFGATVSEIFDGAGANRGLLSYYFQSKEILFEKTIDRRFDRFRDRFLVAFESAPRSQSGAISVWQFCRTYIGFLFDLAHDEDRGWQNYIKLLAVANSIHDQADISLQLSRFDFIIDMSVKILNDAMPAVETIKIEQSLLYLEASVSTLIVSDQLWSQRVHALDWVDHNNLADDMASFFAAALAVHCT